MPSVINCMTGISLRCDWLFNTSQTFEFFRSHGNPAKKNRVAAVYGKNGSGKSTIAQGFREYTSSTNPRTVELSPLANGSHIVITPNAKSEKFFVFDEKYVEQRVKVKEHGLDAIVLFGEQIALEQKMEQITISIDALKEKQLLQETECAKYTNAAVITAPQYWISQITQSLRVNGGWADTRGIKLNGNRTAASVNEAEIDRLGNLVPLLDEAATKAEFDRLFALFTSANLQAQQVIQPVPQHSIVGNIETTTAALLAKVISKPRLMEREKALLQIFGIRIIAEAKDFLSDSAKTICPMCLQEIGEGYRAGILSQIESILNKEVEEFRAALRKLLLVEEVKDNYRQFSVLEAAAYCNVQDRIDELNRAIMKHNSAVQSKIDSPFEAAVYDPSIGLIAACDALNQAIIILEAERVVFNDAVSGRARLKNALIKLNDEIAHYAFETAYSSLVTQRDSKKKARDLLDSLLEQNRKLEDQKRELDAQRKNFQIAVDEINNSLAYIFFSRGRLEVVLDTDQMYHLKSNSKEVDPKKVSCGERNALALCYYFTEIAKDMDARAIYADEVFLAIDDPVSSFDLENRIGILSFMRWKLSQVLLGCPTTKVLVMTHDLSVLYDLEKALGEISKECAKANKSAECLSFELHGAGITHIDENQQKQYNEYTRLLETIYDYALSGTTGTELFIGNTMRRVLEAFSTFVYKKGIAEISRDVTILSVIEEDERTYFQNLMYRLVLNGESHYEEHVHGLQDMAFFGHISPVEKQRTARDILCFMYRLNMFHVLAHLPDAKPEIDGWLASIGGTGP